MLKIYIITEGGRDIGIGHITRCISLCQAFEERGIEPEFVVNGDDIVEDLLSGRKYQIFNWLREEDHLFEIIKGASIAIIDSYLADVRFYKRVSETVEIPVYIDDNNRFDYPGGFIVNGTIYAEELYPNRGEDTTYLLGRQYIPLRKEFWNIHEKEIKDTVESIMVTFGGDDDRGVTPKILKLLRKNYPTLIKNVIIGKIFQDIDRIKKETDNNTILFYYPNAEKMKEVMLDSDVAISAGGQTLYELARVGLPTLGVCVSENQELNLRGFHKSGFLKFTGWYNDNNLDRKMIEMIEKLLRKEERKKGSSIGQRLVDGQGAKRVIARISPSA
jgi:UDP-2,4-diacetamido-2,4,6-trideoxy-beta-L-altropyranose hydrolase